MLRIVLFTSLAMLAFAGNSVFCRLALKAGLIDPLSFSLIRLLSGACVLLLPFSSTVVWGAMGILYAVLSGAVTSGLGYVIWYGVLRDLTVTRASIVQLSVPVISVLAGVWWLQEPLSMPVALSCAGVLGGMAIVLADRGRQRAS